VDHRQSTIQRNGKVFSDQDMVFRAACRRRKRQAVDLIVMELNASHVMKRAKQHDRLIRPH
jgi:hypothetical protein